jgi:hypothetical protein
VASTDLDLRIILVDAETQTEVRQLAHTKTIGTDYEHGRLLFTVPSEGNYRIAFVTDNVMDGGLLLDNILIAEFAIPTDTGINPLVGTGDDNCTTLDGHGLNGDAWTRFQDPSGLLSIEINSNGNDLGDVRVEMTDYGDTPLAPFLGEELLSRYWNITPENGSGPYTNNGGVKVRLYFTADELSDFNLLRGKNRDWTDMVVTHYDGANEDCSLTNSTDLAFDTEIPTATAPFGGTAQYIEFTTTSFSEFGATSAAAAPVTLTSLTARAQGSTNLVEWTVASEVDFSHYSVERSTNGVTFHELAQVVGTQSDRYSLTDPAPAAQQYYRLKMVDLDGSYAYSKIVSVQRPGAPKFQLLEAYPVPTSNDVTLRFESPTTAKLELRVTNALGRVVRHRTIEASAGSNEQPVDLSGLPPATYQLSLLEGGNLHTLRIIKQ